MDFESCYKEITKQFPRIKKKDAMQKAFEAGRMSMKEDIQNNFYAILKKIFKETLNG